MTAKEVPRFSQPQIDAAEAVIALAKSVSGGELTIDELAKVIAEKVYRDSWQSMQTSLVKVLSAVAMIEEEKTQNEERKRRNSHA